MLPTRLPASINNFLFKGKCLAKVRVSWLTPNITMEQLTPDGRASAARAACGWGAQALWLDPWEGDKRGSSFPPDSVISHSHCSEVHFVKNGLKSIKLHLYREIPFKYQSPCFKKMFNNRQTVIENIRVESNTKQQSLFCLEKYIYLKNTLKWKLYARILK